MDMGEKGVAGRFPEVRTVEDPDHHRDHEQQQGGAEQVPYPGWRDSHDSSPSVVPEKV
jgi:hypothetical protein